MAEPPQVPAVGRTVSLLALLYAAQGIPFGIAVEYLPVVLRERHVSQRELAVIALLQLPWYGKVLWAGLVDRPLIRLRARGLLFALQLALGGAVLAYAVYPLQEARPLWFAVTAVAATIAATQDLFVDALAVRSLGASGRGAGNVAQVGGYRLGMLAGGAGLLAASTRIGEGPGVALLAAAIVAAAGGAFALRDGHSADEEHELISRVRSNEDRPKWGMKDALSAVTRAGYRQPLILAIVYKFGIHLASGLLKPMLVDAHWRREEIGGAVILVGALASLAGAALGGVIHRAFVGVGREGRALTVGALLQAAACLPLPVIEGLGAPKTATTIALAAEHGASAAGTTILFAALMSATRRDAAGLHYTVLASGNALGIGLAGLLGGALADAVGRTPVFLLAAALAALAPLAATGWEQAAARSAGLDEGTVER